MQISCGDYHSLVLDFEGRVFSFGDNYDGQLGLGNNKLNNIPQQIPNVNITNKQLGLKNIEENTILFEEEENIFNEQKQIYLKELESLKLSCEENTKLTKLFVHQNLLNYSF